MRQYNSSERTSRISLTHIMRNIAVGIFMAISAIACRNNKPDSIDKAEAANKKVVSVSADDLRFVVQAASGGMMEVELGRMAREQSSSQAVKDFGQTMIDDHSAANGELRNMAATKGITLPQKPGEEHQEMINKLAAKKGNDFDRAYIDMMVTDHEEDIDAYVNELKTGNDMKIKTWVEQKLPTLRHHQEMAEQLQKQQLK
ncbi:DUF4142 domain-containing protein [Rurimicrobium arvi]